MHQIPKQESQIKIYFMFCCVVSLIVYLTYAIPQQINGHIRIRDGPSYYCVSTTGHAECHHYDNEKITYVIGTTKTQTKNKYNVFTTTIVTTTTTIVKTTYNNTYNETYNKTRNETVTTIVTK